MQIVINCVLLICNENFNFFAQKYHKKTWVMRFNFLLHNAYKLYQEYSLITKDLRDKMLDEHLYLLNTESIQADKNQMAFYK